MRQQMGYDVPYLSLLLNNAVKKGNKVLFNSCPYQNSNKSIQTCGRFVLLRILFFLTYKTIKGSAFDKYIKQMKKKLDVNTYDEVVTKMMNTTDPFLM